MLLFYTFLDTPIGQLLLAGEGEVLHFLGFPKGKMAIDPKPQWRRDEAILQQAKGQLQEYFTGQRQEFDLQLAPHGTEFQLQVWQQLQQIPYGRVCSYSELAIAIDRPKAVRAVGAANGQNPIPVIIPCHRVIGANGQLTGFGGGLDTKQHLLKLEGIEVDGERQIALF
ncbi:MAG TPA: cysteine methyltransferase [Oceanospirillaceae bacterium]|nr:cysteine methyltransferase [Oceanospirillaceae bacterium]